MLLGIAGFRKLSDGILASAALSRRDDRAKVAKAELVGILKRAAPARSLKQVNQ